MTYKIKEFNLHITEYCSGCCPMCYATNEKVPRKHGNIEKLKLIVHNAIANGKVERFVMVGGDPCEHPNLVELLKYIKDEGRKFNIDTKNMIISNTHDYRENGKIIAIEEILEYIDGLCFTVHSDNEKEHDEFNGCIGSYKHAIENINKYANIKNNKQEICIIINLMPQTVGKLENIMRNIDTDLNNKVDGFAIQRIAPIGRACGSEKYFIEQEDINKVFETCKKMKEEKGYYFEFVDAFPLCAVNKKYHDMLYKGGCNWGTNYCAVFSDGSISRCAMSEKKLSKNVLGLDTPEKFNDFWQNDPELIKFRNKEHLDEKCRNCKLLKECGGGCVLARITGDPYKTKNPTKGHDYLAKRNN